jgi:hypothetical protein
MARVSLIGAFPVHGCDGGARDREDRRSPLVLASACALRQPGESANPG